MPSLLLLEPCASTLRTALDGARQQLSLSTDVREVQRLPERFEDVQAVLVSYDLLSPESQSGLLSRFSDAGAPPLILVSSGGCRRDFPEWFGRRALWHLLADNEGVNARDLAATLAQLGRPLRPGCEPYLDAPRIQRRVAVRRASQKPEVKRIVDEVGRASQAPDRMVEQFWSAVEELFTNALYNAPVDETGQRRFSHLARNEEIVLNDDEEVDIQIVFDGQRLAAVVGDPFGSLGPAQIQHYLEKCYRRGKNQVDRKHGGAGLGLYYVLESVTHLVVNEWPGKKTEAIALMDCFSTYRAFAERGKSLNVFLAASS